jgi:signal transduction histidine kinase
LLGLDGAGSVKERIGSTPTAVRRETEQGFGVDPTTFIARGIRASHGHRIGLDSEPGTGATFWFTPPGAPELPPGG